MSKPTPIPITVFTGFLGAGKTSVILSLLPQLPKDYKVVLLKNEFGDIEVDSKLASQSSLAGVSEILNGCMCCVLVGQMQNALLEIREKFRPDRIIIECSGSAFPATLAFQIRQLERDTDGDLQLDAIITVVDAENFAGYDDTSPTARMQASYSDIILINKWEHVSERALDFVIDHLNTLNDATPKIKCQGRNGVDPNLIFGLQTKLFTDPTHGGLQTSTHHDEVETTTVYRGPRPHVHNHADEECDCHTQNETPSGNNIPEGGASTTTEDRDTEADVLKEATLVDALRTLSKETVWRVKGFVRLAGKGGDGEWVILNWAFGRFEITRVEDDKEVRAGCVRLTVMGERGEVKRAARRFAGLLGCEVV